MNQSIQLRRISKTRGHKDHPMRKRLPADTMEVWLQRGKKRMRFYCSHYARLGDGDLLLRRGGRSNQAEHVLRTKAAVILVLDVTTRQPLELE